MYKFHLFKNIQKLKYTLEKGPLHRDIISESPQVVSIMTLNQQNQTQFVEMVIAHIPSWQTSSSNII